MPPNCREYYQGIAVCRPDEFCAAIKNPVNYTVKKNFASKPKKAKRATNLKRRID